MSEDRYLPEMIVASKNPEEDWRVARLLNDQVAACDVLNDIITLIDFCDIPIILIKNNNFGRASGKVYLAEVKQTSAGKCLIVISLKDGNDIVDVEYWEDDPTIEEIAEAVFKASLQVNICVFSAAYIKKRETGTKEYLKLVSDVRKGYRSGQEVSLMWKKFFVWETNHARTKIKLLNTLISTEIMYEYPTNTLMRREIEEEIDKIHEWLTLHEVKYSRYEDTNTGTSRWRLDEDT